MSHDHISSEFDRELKTLRHNLIDMAALASAQVDRAVEALFQRSDDLAATVVNNDNAIDRDELEIDERAFMVLLRRQPVASDLRFLMLTLKIVTDIERVGDLAANIAKRVRELNRFDLTPAHQNVQELADCVRDELRLACAAFIEESDSKARAVIIGDAEVDRLNSECFRSIISLGAHTPEDVARALALSSISRYLERIGDHATNIAEMVIYFVSGTNVRHDAALATPRR